MKKSFKLFIGALVLTFLVSQSLLSESRCQKFYSEILDQDIRVSATCVRVPVFIGHSEAISIEFENHVTVEDARLAIKNADGCTLLDEREDGGYVTPKECAGNDETYISRIRDCLLYTSPSPRD